MLTMVPPPPSESPLITILIMKLHIDQSVICDSSLQLTNSASTVPYFSINKLCYPFTARFMQIIFAYDYPIGTPCNDLL